MSNEGLVGFIWNCRMANATIIKKIRGYQVFNEGLGRLKREQYQPPPKLDGENEPLHVPSGSPFSAANAG